MDSKGLNLKSEFLANYKLGLMKLYKTLLPILEEGWTEDQVYDLLVFVEKSGTLIKNKTLPEVVALYKKSKGKK